MKYVWFAGTLLLLLEYNLQAQFYNAGTDPLGIHWQQIKTPEYTLIFPRECSKLAGEFLTILQNTSGVNNTGMNSLIKPLKIVIHNRNVESNGWVMWAPRRMELLTIPPQDNYSQLWMDQLALHEYRHVVQVSKLNQGITKYLSWLTGDFIMGAEVGYLPLWQIEGDAVLSETILSSTGRGRDALFSQSVRAIELLNTKRYSYDQAFMGTYRSILPNHYEYGYQLALWATSKWGDQCWEKSYNTIARKPYSIAPFYFGLKKTSGLSKTGLYKQALDSIGQEWKNRASLNLTRADSVPVYYKSDYVSYRFPHQTNDSAFIALRTSIDNLACLVKLKNGKEEKLFTLGNFYGSQLAYSSHYVAWEEVQYGIRREQESFSVIRLFNLQTNKSVILKSHVRQFSPSISLSGELIALNSVDSAGNSWIEVWNIEKKKRILKNMHPGGQQFTFTSWINNDTLALVCLGTNGKSIFTFSISSQKWSKVYGPTYMNISGICAVSDCIYFTGEAEGKATIFCLKTGNDKLYRVTNMLVGSGFPSVTDSTLLFSEYTSTGYKLRTMKLEAENFTPFETICSSPYFLVDSIAQRRNLNIQSNRPVINEYESEPYRRYLHLFNVHTWFVPFYFDYENFEFSEGLPGIRENLHPGFLVLSQSILSDVSATVGYYYEEGRNYFIPSLYLNTFFPEFAFKLRIGGKSAVENATVTDSLSNFLDNGYLANIRVKLPFRFSSSRFTMSFVPKAEIRMNNHYVIDTVLYSQGTYDFIYHDFYFYQGKFAVDYNSYFYVATKKAYRDLKPRWSCSLYASSYQPQLNRQFYHTNNLWALTLTVPGLLRHHSISVTAEVEDGPGLRLDLPRGYKKADYRFIDYKKQVMFDYTFPLLYPDLSLGPVLYLKRISTNLFYDAASYNGNKYQNHTLINTSDLISSCGAEFMFETHLLRFFMPVVPTVRLNYLVNDMRLVPEFYVSTNYSFSLGRSD